MLSLVFPFKTLLTLLILPHHFTVHTWYLPFTIATRVVHLIGIESLYVYFKEHFAQNRQTHTNYTIVVILVLLSVAYSALPAASGVLGRHYAAVTVFCREPSKCKQMQQKRSRSDAHHAAEQATFYIAISKARG